MGPLFNSLHNSRKLIQKKNTTKKRNKVHSLAYSRLKPQGVEPKQASQKSKSVLNKENTDLHYLQAVLLYLSHQVLKWHLSTWIACAEKLPKMENLTILCTCLKAYVLKQERTDNRIICQGHQVPFLFCHSWPF